MDIDLRRLGMGAQLPCQREYTPLQWYASRLGPVRRPGLTVNQAEEPS